MGGGGWVWVSVTVELDGVDRLGDGPAYVATALLLGLLVAERFALGESEHIIGLLAPVTRRSSLDTEISQQIKNHDPKRSTFVHK